MLMSNSIVNDLSIRVKCAQPSPTALHTYFGQQIQDIVKSVYMVERHNYMNRVSPRRYLFYPRNVLLISIVTAAIFALIVALLFDGELRWFLLYYFTPIGIPFVAFLFDRLERQTQVSTFAWAIDQVVVILALMRAFVPIPLVSGHALFLVYCLLTARSKVARITAVLVLLQVAYLKLFVTHDTALFGGIAAGCLAAWIYRRTNLIQRNIQIENGT
jgi:hypothetical protein